MASSLGFSRQLNLILRNGEVEERSNKDLLQGNNLKAGFGNDDWNTRGSVRVCLYENELQRSRFGG